MPMDESPRRLDVILRALPESELKGLITRMGIRVDTAKRIDVPSQVARALVGLPDVRDPSRLPNASRELLHRIAEDGGVLVVPSLPAGLEPLIARGVVYARKGGAGIELVLPIAFLVQLKSWESEDPRSLRALIAQSSFETMSAIASHYLGRPATPPIALSLEGAWEALSDGARLEDEIERLTAEAAATAAAQPAALRARLDQQIQALLEAIPALVATKAEFVAVGDAVWTHPEGPAKGVEAAVALIGTQDAVR